MRCPKCKSQNVLVQLVRTGARTTTKGRSCLGNLLYFFFFGWFFSLFRRRKYKSKTVFKNEKIAVCQNCGYQFKP